MSKRILVTGGAGFLGTNLVAKLVHEGNEVIVLDDFSTGFKKRMIWPRRIDGGILSPYPPDGVLNAHPPQIEVIRHDVLNPFRIECDEIYHLACPASPSAYQEDPIRTTMIAVQGTHNALRCAEQVGARILIASTSEVYGEPLEHPQSEDLWCHFNPVGERSCYDAGKAAAESLAASFATELHVDVRIARIHNTYGPFMAHDDGRMVSNFICQALRDEALTVYGEGTQTRSLCYVDDMVAGLIGLMWNELGAGDEPVNLGNPHETTVIDVASLIASLCGSTSEIEHEELPGDDPTRRCPDICYAGRMFGFDPKVGLAAGLNHTIRYFRELGVGGDV